jgi:hypothetical protein
MEADLQVAYRLNGSNLRDTGHSSERSRMTVLADKRELAFRQTGSEADY